MTHGTCELMRDLLGAYCDGTCSDAAKRLVEEHAALVRRTREAAAAKRRGRPALRAALPLLPAGAAIVLLFFFPRFFSARSNPFGAILSLAAAAMLSALWFARGRNAVRMPEKTDFLLMGSSAAVFAACAALCHYTAACAQSGQAPFFAASLDQCGSRLEKLLYLCAAAQVLLLAWQIARLQRGTGAGWPLCVSLPGVFLPFAYYRGVFVLLSDAAAVFPLLWRVTGAVCCVGLAGACLMAFAGRERPERAAV